MSWYSKDYKYREAIAVYNAGNATTVDLEFVIASDVSRFWDNVDSTNDDVVLVGSDGITVLDFSVSSWDYANKAATIQINDYALPQGNASTGGAVFTVWMYWGFDDGAQGSPVSVQNANLPALSNAITDTYLEIGDPSRAGSVILGASAESIEATSPSKVIPAAPGIKFHLFWDVTRHLAARRIVYENSKRLEEIDTVAFTIEDSAGATVAAMITANATRVLQPGILRTTVSTLSSDTSANYLLSLTLTTDIGRVLKFYALLKVRAITAPAA
jgi:hypothetical protein